MPTWFKWTNGKWLIGTLAVPAVLGYVAHRYEQVQADRQVYDARLRLYTELLSKREEEDTNLRRGIFEKVLETYLKPGAKDLESKLVALELLTVNFHDSLDLSPLFWQLDRDVRGLPAERRGALRSQIVRIASGVKDRQLDALAVVGASKESRMLHLDQLGGPDSSVDADLSFTDPNPLADRKQLTRHFEVVVREHDPQHRRVLVHVKQSGKDQPETERFFWVDEFDFPLANFTRLSTAERYTVILKRYNPPTAQIIIVFFPSSRSGVKDKPYIDEVISDLLQQPK